MRKKIINKYEHDTLKVGEQNFNDKHYKALVRYNEKNKNELFEIGYNKIIFKQYVGVIQVGDLTIQILPKIDKTIQYADSEKQKWFNVLIEMLFLCEYINLKNINYANLRLKSASLFEIYIYSFLMELENIIKQGLIKKYRMITDNINTIKGKINWTEHLKYNITHKERFFVDFDSYDYNNVLNQILYRALRILERFNLNIELKQKIKRIKCSMPEIYEKNITEFHFENLKLNKLTQRYENVLKLARLIILHYCPDIITGTENVIAILFDMNLLFEEFVYRLLIKYNQNYYKIQYQKQKNFWEAKDRYLKAIRPDLIIYKDNKGIIIDTKWKIVSSYPEDSDLKQIYIYNDLFNVKKSVLLYPKVNREINGRYFNKDFYCYMRECRLIFEYNKLSLKNTYIELKNIINNLFNCEVEF